MGWSALAQSPLGLPQIDHPQWSRGEAIVSHEEWARDLTEAFGLHHALPPGARDADRFALLCPERNEPSEGPPRPLHVLAEVPSAPAGTPIRVIVDVPVTGLYRLSVEGRGGQRWTVDRAALQPVKVTELGLGSAETLFPLTVGPHEVSGRLGQGAAATRVELAVERTLCVAPSNGWQPGRGLTFGAKARSLVHAMGLERHLPALDSFGIEGERYASATNASGDTREGGGNASAGAWAEAEHGRAEFRYRIDLTEPGLYTITARLLGEGRQYWSVDGVAEAWVEPEVGRGPFHWAHVATLRMASGHHVVRARVPTGHGIDRIVVTRRSDRGRDYVDLLEGFGFREGPPGAAVTRHAASANLAQPMVARLASGFLSRGLGGTAFAPPAALTDDELERLYSRPLSPVLPADL
ncbi:MAG: hypothetical protein AAF430_15685 [Myxococcota bacterium]